MQTVASHETQLIDDEAYTVFDPVAYVHGIWRYRTSLILAPLLLGAVFYGLSYAAHKTYRSEVKFMPPKPTGTGGLLLLSRGGGAGDEYRAELNSRTLGMDVVRHMNLAKRLKLKDDDYALQALQGMAKFGTDSNNFVTITATTVDPQLSADVANEYYSALERFSNRLTQKEAEHRLNYMSGPLRVEQQRLETAEAQLADAQASTGLVVPAAQANLGVQEVANLRGRVSELQAQLATMRAGATDQNPRVVALQSQIGNLQGQIHSLETNNRQANSPGNLPKLSLEVTRKQREVELHTATLEALTRSLGVIQTTEGYTPSLSLIDPAIPAKQKYAPSRKQWAMVGFLIGLVIALARAVSRTIYGEWATTPAGRRFRKNWTEGWQKRQAAGVGHGV